MENVLETIASEKPASKTKKSNGRTILFSALAAAFLGGGFAAPFFGLVFFIFHSLRLSEELFSKIGTFLMIIAIPMMLCGSHFLDKLEEQKIHKPSKTQDFK